MHRWGFGVDEDASGSCGKTQSDEHLLTCQDMPVRCDRGDLNTGNDKAIAAAEYWSGVA
jgi:hypothetical protein